MKQLNSTRVGLPPSCTSTLCQVSGCLHLNLHLWKERNTFHVLWHIKERTRTYNIVSVAVHFFHVNEGKQPIHTFICQSFMRIEGHTIAYRDVIVFTLFSLLLQAIVDLLTNHYRNPIQIQIQYCFKTISYMILYFYYPKF